MTNKNETDEGAEWEFVTFITNPSLSIRSYRDEQTRQEVFRNKKINKYNFVRGQSIILLHRHSSPKRKRLHGL